MKFRLKGCDSDLATTHTLEYDVPEILFKIHKSLLLKSVLCNLNPVRNPTHY